MSISRELGDERTLDLPQGTIAYRERGPESGPPLLFLHGLLTNGDLWRRVSPGLAERGFRCLAPDWPLGSHSRPMRPHADLSPPGLARTIADFVEAAGLGPVTLVANDTGGAIAQLVATRHPQILARLVLTNCDAFENFLPPRFRPLQWAGHVPGAVWLAMQAFRLPAVQFSPIGFGPLVHGRIEPRIVASFLAAALGNADVRRDLGKILRGIDSRLTIEAATALPRFDAPTLLAWGADDFIFPLDQARRLVALFPKGNLAVIPGSRCFVPEDQPARLVDEIERFLGETAEDGLRRRSAQS